MEREEKFSVEEQNSNEKTRAENTRLTEEREADLKKLEM